MADELENAGSSQARFLARRVSDAVNEALAEGELEGFAPGRIIGEFQLVRRLGRGGMGEVWEAVQLALERTVALKLLLPERVNERAIDFFAREARAGGKLSHPGIVAVHGAGTDAGVHWIAMELVGDGSTLGESLDELRARGELPASHYGEVVALVAKVADALQAAHDVGVIHRDLKPQNVLLGPGGEPIVGDFGLARLVTEHSLSQTGDFAGTYYYMSPEQVAARRIGIDHRTDVFSLGVILYEVLCLQRPFEGDTAHQIARKVLTWDPPDPRSFRSQVPRDLVVICERAMRKSPGRRYQTMADLAADLRRHLAHEPITARPFSPPERAAKWARRNPTKSVVGTLAATFFAVIATLLYQNVRTNRELEDSQRDLAGANEDLERERARLEETNTDLSARTAEARASADEALRQQALAVASATRANLERDEAARQREVAQAVNDFLNDDLLSSVAPSVEVGRGRDVLMREVLDAAAERVGGRFEGQPEVEARIRETLGRTYRALGELHLAEPHVTRSLSLRREVLGDEHPDTLTAIEQLSGLLQGLGRLDEAEPYCREVLEGRLRVLGDEDPGTLNAINNLGTLLMSRGKFSEAKPYILESLEGYRRTLGEESVRTLRSLNNAGNLLESLGELDQAEEYYRQSVEGKRRVLGDEHPYTLTSINNLGLLLQARGKLVEAEQYLLEGLEVGRRILGDEHPGTVISIHGLGHLAFSRGRFAEAESYFREALDVSRRVLGEDHSYTLNAMNSVGSVLKAQGELAEAELYSGEALAGKRRTIGDDHPDTLSAINNMAMLCRAQGKHEEAEAYFREGLAGFRRVLGDGHPYTLVCLYNLTSLYRTMDRLEDAEPLARELLDLASESDPSYEEFKGFADEVIRAALAAEESGRQPGEEP